MKNEKKIFEFSYSKNMANFETFLWGFLSSTNSEIVRGSLFASKAKITAFIKIYLTKRP